MATLDNGTTWNKSLEFIQQNGKITLFTSQKYIEKNIELNFSIPGIVIPTADTGSTNTFYITVPNGSNGTVTFHFSVDDAGNTTIT